MIEVGTKYNERTLYSMRKFFETFDYIKLNPLGSKLNWSQFREISKLKDIKEIKYYIDICEKNNLTKRALEECIRNKQYDRLPKETKNKLLLENKIEVKDLVPNPILIKNKNNIDLINESALHNLIMEDIELFMNELGNNFSFIGSEYKIKFNNKYNYIDLLLFNIEFNCYVVVELKITELKKEHIGQIQIYMNYIDKNLKKTFHNSTVGIIICKKNNQYVIDYCSDIRIISREYILI